VAVLLKDFVNLLLHIVNLKVPNHHVEVVSSGVVWRLVLALGGKLIFVLSDALS
jgi:hypothetical protein